MVFLLDMDDHPDTIAQPHFPGPYAGPAQPPLPASEEGYLPPFHQDHYISFFGVVPFSVLQVNPAFLFSCTARFLRVCQLDSWAFFPDHSQTLPGVLCLA